MGTTKAAPAGDDEGILSLDRLMEAVEERQERTMEAVGGDAVGRLSEDVVSSAFKDGVLVRLHVSYPRGIERLAPEDLGMRPTPEAVEHMRKALALGSRLTLPRRFTSGFKSVEQGAREALSRLSLSTLFGWFVPCTTYGEWKGEFLARRDAFEALRDGLIGDYDAVREEMRALWLEGAPELWRMANGGAEPPEGHAETAAEGVVARMPTLDALRTGYRFDQELSMVPMPSEAALDALAQDRARRAVSMGAERAALVDEFERDIALEMGERKSRMTGFCDSLQADLAERLLALAAKVHNDMVGRGALTARSAEAARKAVGRIRDLNFLGDAAIEGRLRDVEGAIGAADLSGATDVLRNALASVADACRAEIDSTRRDDPAFALVVRLPCG